MIKKTPKTLFKNVFTLYIVKNSHRQIWVELNKEYVLLNKMDTHGEHDRTYH